MILDKRARDLTGGEYKFMVVKEGYRNRTFYVNLRGGTTREKSVGMYAIQVPVAQPEPIPPPSTIWYEQSAFILLLTARAPS